MADINRYSQDCMICNIMLHEEMHKIFSNRYCSVFFHPRPCAPGHIIIMPNAHTPILEMVADNRLGSMANLTAQFSKMLIEETKATGTQIMVRNGSEAGQEFPHFMIHVIPRHPHDGLDFSWETDYNNDGDLAAIQKKLSPLMQLKNLKYERTEDIYNSVERQA